MKIFGLTNNRRRALAWAGLGAAFLASTEVAAAQTDAERVAKNKQTILSRVERPPTETRGDKPGQIRLKWEWYNKVVASYDRSALVTTGKLKSTDGVYGIRFAHNTDAIVTNLKKKSEKVKK